MVSRIESSSSAPKAFLIGRRAKDESDSLKKREQVVRRALELDKQYAKVDNVSDKVLMMETMSYMRKERDRHRTLVNITYPIDPPYAFVNIIFEPKEGEYVYKIQDPKLTSVEVETVSTVKSKMEATMDQSEIPLSEGGNSFTKSPKLSGYVKKRFAEVCDLFDITIENRRRPIIQYYLERELIGMGRSDAILKDPFIEDISCNGPFAPLFVYHRVFGSIKTNVNYESEMELNRFVIKLAQVSGKHVSIYQPILDATLNDGSRINLTLGSEVTRKGSTFTIRKFSYDPISPIDLLRFGSVSAMQLAYFWTLIENKKSLLVSGGTASGKTTLLNALCMFIKPEDKIVSIEDTPEIQIDHTNWIQSVSRSGYGMSSGSGASPSGVSAGGGKPGGITLFDLLVAALRQRPEYIIVGEVRGQEAFTLFQAISVGHASMGTIHASSIEELMHRVENEPMNIPRVLFQALDAVIFQGLVTYDGRRVRRIKMVTEILEVETTTKNLLTNNSYVWSPKNDVFGYTGRSFVIEQIAKDTGKRTEDLFEEIKKREEYLKLIDSKNMTYYKDVSRAISMYYVDPKMAFAEIQKRK
jgi:archaeal flagellar protein FlaI